LLLGVHPVPLLLPLGGAFQDLHADFQIPLGLLRRGLLHFELPFTLHKLAGGTLVLILG
jgi:hypothetical protein